MGLTKKDDDDESHLLGEEVVVTKLEALVNWGRKNSFFLYPFVTACCAMEYMSVSGPRYDLERFGAALPRFSPRQADTLFVVGTVSHKQAPILLRVYNQMTEPKWVFSCGVCATSGGFYDNYATLQGIDTIVPVDVYIPGCPPRPEMILDGIIRLQEKVMKDKFSNWPVGASRLARRRDTAFDSQAIPEKGGEKKS